MKISLLNFWQTVRYLLMHALFWLILFFELRLLFVAINSNQAIDTDKWLLLQSLFVGMRFDFSIIGYLSLLTCFVVIITTYWHAPAKSLRFCRFISGILACILVFTLPANAVVYGHWLHHVDAVDLGMFSNDPMAIFDSTESWIVIIYTIAAIGLSVAAIYLLRRLTNSAIEAANNEHEQLPGKLVRMVATLVMGAVMILPIRGGVGIAPLNTGHAFFCNSTFANHTALNPAWNFCYSLKRARNATVDYHFMNDDDAQRRFNDLMYQNGDYPRVLNSSRPNVVILLLESFSAHTIEFLGGENVAKNIKALVPESIVFDNVMAASDRSGKGLVAVMCGYPVLPTISIIQYPSKTQSLPYIAKSLRENGYASQTFIYGGDLHFNNFNSLITMAGFDNIITQEDFPKSEWGDKWGAHDEFTLNRLLSEMDKQEQPFFDAIFTLSSHEPFTVPMKRKFENDYFNSVAYTDSCIGDFFAKARTRSWWNNTLFILVADHGHGGPNNVANDNPMRFRIPLIMTGGALAVKDTVVHKPGTQIDIAATLLSQLDIEHSQYTFSKNLLDKGNRGFSFYDFSDGFGYADSVSFQVFDNQANKYIRIESETATPDTISGKAILQMMCNDNKKR
ncbi:MAG: sulfatase [Bacteroidales bacterium]|jgi:phosphoglycerol transferase MdoB-like AlkP superfamily enzyme|nr:sulfatase [Bacteroidales bacterium]